MKLPLVLFSVLFACALIAQPKRPELPPPTHANVAYGDHPEQVLDFWKADIGYRGPVAIYIHGGGFTGGNKGSINPATVVRLVESGIHVAAVEYRRLKHAKLPAAHRDVARAVQFIRSKAGEWAVDTKLVGAFGGSAGAQLSAYLAFHDDLADPDSPDPIDRQSTRLFCVAPTGGQSTMDLNWWVENIPGYDAYHVDPSGYFETEGAALEKQVRDVSIVNLISPDDPPVFMNYNMSPDAAIPEDPKRARGWKVHHVNFGLHLQEKLDAAGVESTLKYPGAADLCYDSVVEFLVDKLAWKGERSLYEGYEPGVFESSGDSIAYQLLKPANFDPAKRYPLVLFLHGSGGRGPANIRNLTDADVPARLATDSVSGSHDAYYLVPQCPGPNTWTVGGTRPSKQPVLLDLVDHVVASERIDRSRLYVTGLSMGGFGTFSAVSARPDFWAAAAPVCGGWRPEEAERFTKTPFWLFHGDQDRAVAVDRSRDMNRAIAAAGGDVQYTEYPGVGHDSWLNAYWDPKLWDWMFAQRR